MHFRFNEEQLELGRAARRFLEIESTTDSLRASFKGDALYDAELYKRIAEELGWLALLVPEEYDGIGLTPVDLMPILEEMGRSLYRGPFFSTVCLGINALLLGGSEAQKEELLPLLASGEETITLAYSERHGRHEIEAIETQFEERNGEFILSGAKRYVLDGMSADRVIVAARAAGSVGDEGIRLFLVAGDAEGMRRDRLPTVDISRNEAEIVLESVKVGRDAIIGEELDGAALLESILDRARAALAVEQVGAAERCLDMAVAYSLERKQFGRPIGSFQAIKHKAADMLWKVESARSIAYAANVAAASDDAALLRELASSAKAYASDALFFCASENIQIHGGVGFTWEYDPHFYFKRAKASEELLGHADFHRERVARAMGL